MADPTPYPGLGRDDALDFANAASSSVDDAEDPITRNTRGHVSDLPMFRARTVLSGRGGPSREALAVAEPRAGALRWTPGARQIP